MEGKIDIAGRLWIKRGNEYKMMKCRFSPHSLSDGNLMSCNDGCSKFQEPLHNIPASEWKIKLCHNDILFFENFIDLR